MRPPSSFESCGRDFSRLDDPSCDGTLEVQMGNVEIIKGTYEAFGRGDMPAVLGAMDPAIAWHQAEGNPYRPNGDAWIGPDAVLNNLFVRIGADWDGFDIKIRAIHDAGETVVVELRYSGTFKATGKAGDTQACHIWGLRDGRIVSFQQYLDTAKLQDVMGAKATA
jgi:ketosteroid isomerase-like protein